MNLYAIAAALSWLVSAGTAAPVRPVPLITPNDFVGVTAGGFPEVAGDFVVDSEGNITMLYVNQVHMAGLTTTQAAGLIRRLLKCYYYTPNVTVTIIGHVGAPAVGQRIGRR